MKKKSVWVAVFFILTCNACSQNAALEIPVVQPRDILKSFADYWDYSNKFLKFSEDFISLDTNSNIIAKDSFFRQLITGKYLPLRLVTGDVTHYRLYSINSHIDDDIYTTIKNTAITAYKHFKMEGKVLPEFECIDMNGKIYNQETIKNKIVVIKCWFIKCKPCLAEVPPLNKLIGKYKSREDIVFISLATDKENELSLFLEKTKFDIGVVANQGRYMEYLNIDMYPTYIIIDKNSLVSKVVNSYEEMEIVFKKEILK